MKCDAYLLSEAPITLTLFPTYTGFVTCTVAGKLLVKAEGTEVQVCLWNTMKMWQM